MARPSIKTGPLRRSCAAPGKVLTSKNSHIEHQASSGARTGWALTEAQKAQEGPAVLRKLQRYFVSSSGTSAKPFCPAVLRKLQRYFVRPSGTSEGSNATSFKSQKNNGRHPTTTYPLTANTRMKSAGLTCAANPNRVTQHTRPCGDTCPDATMSTDPLRWPTVSTLTSTA